VKLTRIRIANYRSIKSLDFDFPENGMLVLVGSNNAGKSNIIRAVNNVLGAEWWSNDKLERHDFYGHTIENRISIDLFFEWGNSRFQAR
jgi:putative ATP-dependent endonuclease of the OLD family